jgi:hypothetical protein
MTISKILLIIKKKAQFYITKSRYMNKYLSILIFIIVFVLAPAFVQTAIAQPPPPGNTAPIPIDGGLGLLLAAGVTYAAKKLYKQRSKEI